MPPSQRRYTPLDEMSSLFAQKVRWVHFRWPSLFLLWDALAIAAIVAGFAITLYLEAVRLTGAFLPCNTAVCGQLERDPLNANPWVKLATVGVVGYGLLLFLIIAAAFGSPRLAAACLRFGRFISTVGFLVSLLLVGYVIWRYHGFCPWCTASAVCIGVAAMALVSFEPRVGPISRWSIVPGGVIGLVAFGLLLGSQASYAADSRAAATLSVAELAPSTCRLSSGELASVAFVDFGCISCRRLVLGLFTRKEAFGLRIVPPRDPYARAAAQLFYRVRSIEERRQIVWNILNDTTMTTAALDRLEATYTKLTLSTPDDKAARGDASLARLLRIKGTPAWLLIEHGGVRLATAAETANASR